MEQTLSTLAFGRYDSTMVLVTDKRNPSSADWSAWVEAYGHSSETHAVRRLLVVSEGGGPNAAQRREVVQGLVQRSGPAVLDAHRTVVCCDMAVARFISAALGWLTALQSMKVVGFEERRRALDYLGVPEADQAPILEGVRRLQQELRNTSDHASK